MTSRREINVPGRMKKDFLGFEIKQMRKISITAVRSDEVLGINGVAWTPHIVIMPIRFLDCFLTRVPTDNFSLEKTTTTLGSYHAASSTPYLTMSLSSSESR